MVHNGYVLGSKLGVHAKGPWYGLLNLALINTNNDTLPYIRRQTHARSIDKTQAILRCLRPQARARISLDAVSASFWFGAYLTSYLSPQSPNQHTAVDFAEHCRPRADQLKPPSSSCSWELYELAQSRHYQHFTMPESQETQRYT